MPQVDLEMMKIFRQAARFGRKDGFSLLEIIVVLAIMGLMLSIISVDLGRSIDAARFVKTAEAAVGDVKLLRVDALMYQEIRVMVTDDTPAASLRNFSQSQVKRYSVPKDWVVNGQMIKILSSGACLGGQVIFNNPQGRKIEFTLSPPKCEAVRS